MFLIGGSIVEIRRRAAIAFKCKENKTPAILVDLVTKSILVSRFKTDKQSNGVTEQS
jgi:hypothetical protein